MDAILLVPANNYAEKYGPRQLLSVAEKACAELNNPRLKAKATRKANTVQIDILDRQETMIATGRITTMRGNSAILIFSGAKTIQSMQRRGIGKIAHALRLAIATQYRASACLATVVIGNSAQERIMARHGWASLWSYTNANGQQVCLFINPMTNAAIMREEGVE